MFRCSTPCGINDIFTATLETCSEQKLIVRYSRMVWENSFDIHHIPKSDRSPALEAISSQGLTKYKHLHRDENG
jgi:hypothetical protein